MSQMMTDLLSKMHQHASDDITELIASGATVDNEGPAPENTVPLPPTTEPVGVWEEPVICHR